MTDTIQAKIGENVVEVAPGFLGAAWKATEEGKRVGFNPATMLGFIPSFLNYLDERPAREQIDEAYGFAGGWRPIKYGSDAKWRMDPKTFVLTYDCKPYDFPGETDEVYPPLAEAKLRDERILYYDSSWVAIVQPDGSFEVSRLD